MKKETYYCDKCKTQVDNADDLQRVVVMWGDYRNLSEYSYSDRIEMELCVPCQVKVGMIRQVIEKNKLVNEPQDLKERLFDVMADLVHEIHGEVDHE